MFYLELLVYIYFQYLLIVGVESRRWHKSELTTEQMVNKMGLTFEKHIAITEDGYSLSIFRIYKNITCKNSITLVHGLASNSDSFVFGGKKSMVFRLAVERGYELWLPNLRGTTYSLNHTSLNPKHKKYWQFSHGEIGIYDLPAICDVILNHQNGRKTTMFGMSLSAQALSVFEAIKSKQHIKCVNHQIFITPNIFYRHLNPDLRVTSYYWEILQVTLNKLNKGRMKPSTFRNPRKNLLYQLGVNSHNQTNVKEPVSVKYFIHILQHVHSELFQHFDYGESKNMKIYGNEKPPIYDLSKNKICTDVYAGKNDKIIKQEDVQFYHSMLPQEAKCRLNVIDNGEYSNLDFLPISKNIEDLFYDMFLNNLYMDNICNL